MAEPESNFTNLETYAYDNSYFTLPMEDGSKNYCISASCTPDAVIVEDDVHRAARALA